MALSMPLVNTQKLRFSIVKDISFQSLKGTGNTERHIASVQHASYFTKGPERIQEPEGEKENCNL